MKYLAVLLGSMLSNFIFQFFLKQPNYMKAIEISFFQTITILVFFIVNKLED